MIVNWVVPAMPEVEVAVMVATPCEVAVATLALKVAAPDGSGEAVQVTALVRSCVELSV